MKPLCIPEWHFVRVEGGGSRYVGVIYNVALRESLKHGGLFRSSVTTFAEYFRANKKTIRKAIHQLVSLGFFQKVQEVPGRVPVYRVFTHSQWAAAHPGRCNQENSDDGYLGVVGPSDLPVR